jgi:hypothetical protein
MLLLAVRTEGPFENTVSGGRVHTGWRGNQDDAEIAWLLPRRATELNSNRCTFQTPQHSAHCVGARSKCTATLFPNCVPTPSASLQPYCCMPSSKLLTNAC